MKRLQRWVKLNFSEEFRPFTVFAIASQGAAVTLAIVAYFSDFFVLKPKIDITTERTFSPYLARADAALFAGSFDDAYGLYNNAVTHTEGVDSSLLPQDDRLAQVTSARVGHAGVRAILALQERARKRALPGSNEKR